VELGDAFNIKSAQEQIRTDVQFFGE